MPLKTVSTLVSRSRQGFGHVMEDQFVHDRWRELGFDNLLSEEKDYILIWWLVAEVFNGTFAQYFSNETGDHALQALDGLKKCGAIEGARLLQDAMDLFLPYGGYTRDREVRNGHIDQLESEASSPPEGMFRQLSNAFQDSTEPMLSLALKRVKDAYKQEGIELKKTRG